MFYIKLLIIEQPPLHTSINYRATTTAKNFAVLPEERFVVELPRVFGVRDDVIPDFRRRAHGRCLPFASHPAPRYERWRRDTIFRLEA
jgi:hypothetical protein